MSALVNWSGATLTAEQELARLAYALREVHSTRRLTLDNYTPASQEPYITLSEAFYPFATTSSKQHLIIVATLPIRNTAGQFAVKPWLNIEQWGTEVIPAAYGTA